MDFDSSSKFISSLAKFLQSLCNGYVEFDNGVEVIGHIYLNVDTGKKIDYILNEKVCKTDENSVTFISNSFHAQPAEKPKPAPKNLKSTDQDKPSDPGGLPGDDDEIMILDDAEARNVALELREGPASSPHSKTVRPPNASKRSYSQSFASQKHLAKHSRADPSSTQSPNGAHHDSDSIHSERSNSSTNFISSQLPQESLTSESDPSQLPSVFPHTFGDSSNNQGSTGKDIKQEPSNDMNLLHVKQEYDPSGQEEEHEAYGDSQDQSLYSGLYDEQYYPGARRGQSQRVDFNQSGSVDQGELFPGAAGTSGDVGDASALGKAGQLYLSNPEVGLLSARTVYESLKYKCPPFPCPFCDRTFLYRNHFDGHVNTHLKIKSYVCHHCNGQFAYAGNLSRHKRTCQKRIQSKVEDGGV
ncbi:zinc finger and BTB domain-containing protein 43 isoform X16 [Aplysia californica]|uniref:Zinc finger and BTB domain-containing protein 43 isoform X16 n=1 Tax=Aplysia californica TaxID=6500 RepID=A0ABM0ZXL1_APLCA|nr:zinc finger and BTB domain-containing protein 43 isoform X16 [Aplysia californica]